MQLQPSLFWLVHDSCQNILPVIPMSQLRQHLVHDASKETIQFWTSASRRAMSHWIPFFHSYRYHLPPFVHPFSSSTTMRLFDELRFFHGNADQLGWGPTFLGNQLQQVGLGFYGISEAFQKHRMQKVSTFWFGRCWRKSETFRKRSDPIVMFSWEKVGIALRYWIPWLWPCSTWFSNRRIYLRLSRSHAGSSPGQVEGR